MPSSCECIIARSCEDADVSDKENEQTAQMHACQACTGTHDHGYMQAILSPNMCALQRAKETRERVARKAKETVENQAKVRQCCILPGTIPLYFCWPASSC